MTSTDGTYDTQASKDIRLNNVTKIMHDLGVTSIYVKKLSPNDNSKNQPYFGGHLTDLSFIPTGEILTSDSESQKTTDPKRKIKYLALLDLSWVDASGVVYPAPNSKLIYYPQYPEVRFSGFLSKSAVDISKWMSPDKQGRSEGRWLILGITKNKKIYAYLATPESNLSHELAEANYVQISKVLWQLDGAHSISKESTRDELKSKLLEIHQMGWIPSQKLGSGMISEPYKAQNGGGYTLEAMLGIPPNGIALPDYLGWEVKQFNVARFPNVSSKPSTLFTPEPNGGFYNDHGAIAFVKAYGYPDQSGKEDRLNFGGKHIANKCQSRTKLTMTLLGFDSNKHEITDAEGKIALIDGSGNVSASWSFAKIMEHWKRKHSQAVYVPCMKRTHENSIEYHYGKDIELGEGTSFEMFLTAMHLGAVYYDPGIKVERVSDQFPQLKPRSQFRVAHKHLSTLYKKFEFINLS